MKIILWILIVAAVIAVCIKKIKDFKKGKYCGCSCSDCLNKCKNFKEAEDDEF